MPTCCSKGFSLSVHTMPGCRPYRIKLHGSFNYFLLNAGPNPHGFGTFSDSRIRVLYDEQGDSSSSETYPSSASNFAFFYRRVLFVGINQVGGSSEGDEGTRVANNLKWVKSKMAQYSRRMKTLVIFAHADMLDARWEYFGKQFQSLLRDQYPDIFCLYA